jgi:hypothetical protein
MEDPNMAAKKKAIHIEWRWENRKKKGIFDKEMKENVVIGRIHLTIILIDAKGKIFGLRTMYYN